MIQQRYYNLCHTISPLLSFLYCIKALFFFKMPSLHLIRLLQHPLDEYCIPARRIVNKYMRYSADQLSILDQRASAHALYNPARFIQKPLICDLYDHALAGRPLLVAYADDLTIIRLYLPSVQGTEELGRACLHLILPAYLDPRRICA